MWNSLCNVCSQNLAQSLEMVSSRCLMRTYCTNVDGPSSENHSINPSYYVTRYFSLGKTHEKLRNTDYHFTQIIFIFQRVSMFEYDSVFRNFWDQYILDLMNNFIMFTGSNLSLSEPLIWPHNWTSFGNSLKICKIQNDWFLT
jgi:hypothetical protein